MQRIDESRLESDLKYRFQYLCEFMGFTEDDVAILHRVGAKLAARVPQLVEAVYAKLASYDATWRHFLPRQEGYEGPLAADLHELTQDHPVIQFRKQHLARYLTALVKQPYDARMVAYLDRVGQIHTPKAGSKELDVPLVQMNALLGFVADALTNTLFDLGLPRAEEIRAVRAFCKLLWLQNDLINRHYRENRPGTIAPFRRDKSAASPGGRSEAS